MSRSQIASAAASCTVEFAHLSNSSVATPTGTSVTVEATRRAPMTEPIAATEPSSP